MDLDDIFPQTPSNETSIGADLSQMSIAELEERIVALNGEVERVEKEISSRQSLRNAAEQAFKS